MIEEIRDAAENAFAKIDRNPDRMAELSDEDLASVALHVKILRPMTEETLVALCGGIDAANAALARVQQFSQGKLITLVRAAHVAMKGTRGPSVNQLAALVFDCAVGCGAVQVEQQRRAALRANAMH